MRATCSSRRLARGELHCIGATTLDEYRKYIEKDAALERRFQKVMVDEPSVEDTIAILRGLQEKYEVHHGVEITDPGDRRRGGAIASLHHRSLPAGQGDRPDRRGGGAHQDGNRLQARGDGQARAAHHPAQDRARSGEEGEGRSLAQAPCVDREEIANLEREYADLEEIWKAEKAQVQGTQHIKEELERLKVEMEAAKRKGDWQKVSELQYGRIPQLEAQLKKAESVRKARRSEPRLLRTQVGAEEIAEVVSRATGIPVSKMMQGEREKLLLMEEHLHRARGRAGRGCAAGVRRDPPLARGLARSQSAVRLVPVPRAHRRGQDRAVQSAGGFPVRFGGSPDPHRHVRVHGEALRRAADRRTARLCRLRGRRLSHRGRAPQALFGDPARRGGEGASRTCSTCCCRC